VISNFSCKICKTFWLDIDKTKQNIIDAIANVDKSKLIVIANVTSRSKIDHLGIDQDNVIFKPVTLTKLKAILTKTASTSPELVEKAIQAQATQFDAKVRFDMMASKGDKKRGLELLDKLDTSV